MIEVAKSLSTNKYFVSVLERSNPCVHTTRDGDFTIVALIWMDPVYAVVTSVGACKKHPRDEDNQTYAENLAFWRALNDSE